MYNSPFLYSRTKTGALQSWCCWSDGPDIHTEYGLVDGLKQRASKRAEPTNVGRSNERDAVAQAAFEAEAMTRKKIDKGYRVDPAEAMDVTGGVMLAKEYEPKRIVGKKVFSQPKLDGLRCKAFWAGERLVLQSRGNKEYTIPHVADALRKVLPHDMELDGELYCHGFPLQTLASWAKKVQEKTRLLAYHVYDAPGEGVFEERHERLRGFMDREKPFIMGLLHEVDTVLVDGHEGVLQMHHRWLSAGYEGSIIRTACGEYDYGKRSYTLLKVKDFQDAEYEIVGVEEGVGKMAGKAVLVCKTPEDRTFNVVMKGTMEERETMFNDRDNLIGKMATVKFFALTNDNIPQFPVGIAIRDYE